MLIMFEGAESVGKTTLIKCVSQRLNIPVIKQDFRVGITTLNGDAIEQLVEVYTKTISQFASRCDCLVDRFGLMSSLVYAPLFDRQHDISYIEDLWESTHGHLGVILLTANDPAARLRLRGDDLQKDPELNREIDRRYRTIFDVRKMAYPHNRYAIFNTDADYDEHGSIADKLTGVISQWTS